MADRDLTWRDEQKVAFGRRLKAARLKRYRTAGAFIDALMTEYPGTHWRVYYYYEAGKRIPAEDEMTDLIAGMLNTTAKWLLNGSRADINEGSFKPDRATINQALEIPRTKPSKSPALRYIPILSASHIKMMLLGNRDLAAMSREQLPVPQHVDAGADAFYYRIPDGDTSMVGSDGFSFPPRTLLLIDPDRTISPGDFLLAEPPGADAQILRRLQAPLPMSAAAPRFPLRLLALNPMVDPLIVHNRGDCKIIGRVVSFTQIL